MNDRASIPPTLPRDNPTISYWQDPPNEEVADLRTTAELPETADVVVVGSGISGACISYGLLGGELLQDDVEVDSRSAMRVVMLEARQACSGATGRNGGHTKHASYRSFTANLATLGAQEAVKSARLEYDNMRAKQAFIKRHSIPCDICVCDTVDIIYDPAQWKASVRSVELMRKLMPQDLDGAARYTIHTAAEAKEKFACGGDEPVGAISYPAGSLSAYKLVVGILKLALRRGLNLQTHTAAISLQKDGDGMWLVKTDRSEGRKIIKAKRVVLATNGYTSLLYPKLQGIIVPLRGQITAHRPGSAFPQNGLPVTYSFIYSDGYEYMITRPAGSKFAGDVVIGGGLVKAPESGLLEYGTTDDTTVNKDISQYLRETTPRYFGKAKWGKDHADGRIRQEWTGIMGYSPDGFPLVGEVPGEKDLWVSASFQGHGMVLCFLCAKATIDMMLGRDGDLLKAWFPEAYRISPKRMELKFEGKRHSIPPDQKELKAKL